MRSPLVSIVMPVYNAQTFLGEAIESVLAQTFGDFEFVIVDDGSTDHSLALIEHYAANDGRIRWFSRPNTGIVGSLNDGIQAARGELLARMDADDWSLPKRLETQVQFMQEHRDCVVVGTSLLVTDPIGAPIYIDHAETDPVKIGRDLLEFSGLGIGHPTVVMRRDAVIQVGGYRSEYQWSEDRDLWFRLEDVGRLANVSDVLYKYRYHLGSICHQRHLQQHQLKIRLVKETCRRRGIPLPTIVEEWELQNPIERTVLDHYQRWCELAMHAGNWHTARKYALKAFRSEPRRRAGWWLLCESLMGQRATSYLKRTYRRVRSLDREASPQSQSAKP
jgi:glycosyltransferase involved in cell wall biosynthesis